MTELHGPVSDMSALGFAAGEVATVTGAASGIGRATALTAARAGVLLPVDGGPSVA